MCGRAAQTQHAVFASAAVLQVENIATYQKASSNSSHCNNGTAATTSTTEASDSCRPTTDGSNQQQNDSSAVVANIEEEATINSNLDSPVSPTRLSYEWSDNFNLSPGMDAMVFVKQQQQQHDDHNNNNNATNGRLEMQRKIWGLISRGGTAAHPLPTGMNQHFQALMFNARSDTLFQKPTFARLCAQKRSCLIALEGFFEWNESAVDKKKKQPYFVYRNNKNNNNNNNNNTDPPCLLLPGLWTRVPTGRPDDPLLDTFTIITTEVCPALAWLHTRMPLLIWNVDLAHAWLDHPCEAVLRQLEQAATAHYATTSRTTTTATTPLAWHAVTPAMSSTKFRSAAALQPLPKFKTVQSFFRSAAPAPKTAQRAGTTTPSRSATTTTTAIMSPQPTAANEDDDDQSKSPLSSSSLVESKPKDHQAWRSPTQSAATTKTKRQEDRDHDAGATTSQNTSNEPWTRLLEPPSSKRPKLTNIKSTSILTATTKTTTNSRNKNNKNKKKGSSATVSKAKNSSITSFFKPKPKANQNA